MLNSINSALSYACKVRKITSETLNPFLTYKFFGNASQAIPGDLNDKGLLSVIKTRLSEAKAPFEDGYTCLRLKTCTICDSKQNNSASTTNLFINKKTGNFVCHQCKISGNWSKFNTLLRLKSKGSSMSELLDYKKECKNYDITEQWKEMVADCEDLCDMDDGKFRLVMQEFDLLHSKKENVKDLNIKLNRKRNLLLFPMIYQNSVLGFITLDSAGNSSTFPKTDCSGFLSSMKHKKSSAVLVVADIKDFIALGSLNLSLHIVCLPYGVIILPQDLLCHFEKYDKIILWLGVKPGAWNSSIQFAKKLFEKRCYLIRPTENQTSAVNAISNSRNITEIIKNAKPIWHQFVTTFSKLREDVLAEIQNVNEISGVQWTRFPKLNKILKGHRRGELTVLTGPTGSGKTTFLSEYSLDLALNGVNTLWGSFEIKNSRLARTMLQQYSEVPLRDNNLDDFNFWADKFEKLPIYFLTFHGQHSIRTVMNAVEHCFYVYDIAHIIIDNVQFMIDISGDSKYIDRFWAQDCILQAFRRFATGSNCHVTLVVHPRKESEVGYLSMNSIFGSAKTAQEADNILIIQQEEDVKSKKYLQICKNRYTGNLGSMPLIFNESTCTFSQKKPNHSLPMNEEEYLSKDNIYMKM